MKLPETTRHMADLIAYSGISRDEHVKLVHHTGQKTHGECITTGGVTLE